MARKRTDETKGPVGEESPPAPEADLAVFWEAQQAMGKLLTDMGPLLIATSATATKATERIDTLERAVFGLLEVVRQLHGALQESRRF